MNATSGTNAAIWTNFLIAAATAIAGILDPSMLAAVLGPKLALFAPGIIAGINWLLHSLTGNSATSALPGVPVIGAALTTTATPPEAAR